MTTCSSTYQPHRTFEDNDAFHAAEILSIVDDDFPLVLSSRFVLSRHHRVRKVVPGVIVDENSKAPLEVRPHWRIIGNYRLTYGGTRGRATGVLHAAANARENASLMQRPIIKKTRKMVYAYLTDAFSDK